MRHRVPIATIQPDFPDTSTCTICHFLLEYCTCMRIEPLKRYTLGYFCTDTERSRLPLQPPPPLP